jgi:signal transduction histidine kinase
MSDHRDGLFDIEVWRPALEKYGAVTHLTVALYDTTQRLVCEPLPSTRLFAFFRQHGYQPGIVAECIGRCLGSGATRPAVIVSHSYGLAVVGTSLVLDGEVVGAALAQYALVDFCRASAIESLAREAGIPFRRLWHEALQIQPLSERRLAMHGDLLRVLGDTILRENARTRQVQEIAADLEQRVTARTAELGGANLALAQEVRERTEAEARARKLLARLVLVREEERHRIARDIHDHFGQQMTALKLSLEVLGLLGRGSTDWQEHLGRAQALAGQLDADVEALTRELRPLLLENFGLVRALSSLVSDWGRHCGIATRFHGSAIDQVPLGPEAEVNLFRIAQEALNNVHKHANASSVDVQLQLRDDAVVLVIEDDGEGFEEPASAAEHRDQGMGHIGMHERATLMHGTLEVESRRGGGTTVIIAVPIGAPTT